MPSALLQSGTDLFSTDLFSRDDVKPYLMQRLPTPIDNMSPSHPFIRAISGIPVAPGIAAHSIIAVDGAGPPENGADGVVKYVSAHIDGVESEFVVRLPHPCQANPNTIDEVRRILHLHAEQVMCGRKAPSSELDRAVRP